MEKTTYSEPQTTDKALVVSNVSSFIIWLSSGIHHSTGGACHVTKVFLTQILTTKADTCKIKYLQVNALSERIIRIYLHEFTNNERENSIPHSAASCGIENFEFIVSERVNIFIIQIEYTANKNGYYTTIMTSRRLFRHNPVSRGTNQPIRKSEFVQCMKFE